MNPEDLAIKKLDKLKRPDHIKATADKLLAGHERITDVMNKIALNPNDFRDLYGDQSVNIDLEYVNRRAQEFKKSASEELKDGLTFGQVRMLAERAEYEIIRGINVANWLPLMKAYKTAAPDDIGRGVDIILEVTDSELLGHLGLGVDITFTQDPSKKFIRIKEEIEAFDGDRNRLAKVKYFKSQNFRGELSGICRVVAAIDLGMLEDLAKTKNEALTGHIARHEILLSFEHQLAVFADYANRVNPPALEVIQRTQNFVRKIVVALESENAINQSEYGRNRKANLAIEKGLDIFRQ